MPNFVFLMGNHGTCESKSFRLFFSLVTRTRFSVSQCSFSSSSKTAKEECWTEAKRMLKEIDQLRKSCLNESDNRKLDLLMQLHFGDNNDSTYCRGDAVQRQKEDTL